MERIRSFIAIELPGEVKQQLARLQERLRYGGAISAKWVDPQGIHLTLKFLGDIDTDMAARLPGVLEAAMKGVTPFSLELKGLGAFPDLQRVRVVWVGMEGDTASLAGLQRAVETNLATLGFAPEKRRFSPHLTLARVRDVATPEERKRLGNTISSTSFETAARFEVKSVHLMRSRLTREGAVYSRLSSIGLE